MTNVYFLDARAFGRNDGLFVVLSRSGSLHKLILEEDSVSLQKISDLSELNINTAKNANIVVENSRRIYVVLDDTIVELTQSRNDLWTQSIKRKQSIGMIDLWRTHVDYPGKIIRKDGLIAEIRKDACPIISLTYRFVISAENVDRAPIDHSLYELQFLEYIFHERIYHFEYNQQTEILSVEIAST